MQQPKLFAVMLGGRSQGCQIELHDLVFIVDESVEAAHERLIDKWFGNTHRGLHIDCFRELDIIDGYKINLCKQAPEKIDDNKFLYCVNFGGYKADHLGELHEIDFYVDSNKKTVIKRARADLLVGTHIQHCDDNLVIGGTGADKTVDDIIDIGFVEGYYIHLEPTEAKSATRVVTNYKRLDILAEKLKAPAEA